MVVGGDQRAAAAPPAQKLAADARRATREVPIWRLSATVRPPRMGNREEVSRDETRRDETRCAVTRRDGAGRDGTGRDRTKEAEKRKEEKRRDETRRRTRTLRLSFGKTFVAKNFSAAMRPRKPTYAAFAPAFIAFCSLVPALDGSFELATSHSASPRPPSPRSSARGSRAAAGGR